ncbi:MAG: ATPase [Vicingus serpentipes]|nr:ATPase [Vicingus serpentipes]
MIIVADSGSTKTDWRLVKNDNEILPFNTIGFNPYFITGDSVIHELTNSELLKISGDVSRVFFYGAGCSSLENNQILQKALATFFKQAKVEVEHDMLAAARALCGNEKGMAAIIGTGSNSCMYDGSKIVDNVKALGFILGDYGSGADIGKTFIKAYLEKELPEEISVNFMNQYNLSANDILEAVYKKPLPNRFLAGFNLFVLQYLDHPFIKEMLENRFDLFFKKNICKYTDYQNYKLSLVGSIAFVYQDLIGEIAKKYKVEVGKIIRQPIDELVNYHLKVI